MLWNRTDQNGVVFLKFYGPRVSVTGGQVRWRLWIRAKSQDALLLMFKFCHVLLRPLVVTCDV